MQFLRAVRAPLTRCFGYIGTCFLTGCGSGGLFSRNDGQRSTLSLSTIDLTGVDTHVESDRNGEFDQAERVVIGADPIVIQGAIDSGADVDIYDLGAVEPGDEIFVEMTTSGALDGAIALFDDTGSSLLVNDHRNVYLGVREPFIQTTIQHASDNCYVAVSATPAFRDSGTYTLLGAKSAGVTPTPHPDTVLMVFDGAENVRIGSRSAVDVPPFDTADISPIFDGLTDDVVARVVELVREDFASFDVTIVSSSEGAAFASGMSRLFFGTFDAALLGVAEGVDEYNGDQQQEAIVFTDTFRAFLNVDPSPEQLAQALANVASHEIGHLLGLVHTQDPNGIMDVTASLRQLMRDQAFTQSPIYELVFPVGLQDAVTYLLEAVGGNASLAFAKEREHLQRRSWDETPGDGPPARFDRRFSSCGLDHGSVDPCLHGQCDPVTQVAP